MTHRQFSHSLAAYFAFVACAVAPLPAQVINATPEPSPTGVQQAVGDAESQEQAGAVNQTVWPGIPLPKITMPTLTMPKLHMPDMSPVVKPVTSGFSKVSAGTKKAWEGTKEMFSFGGSKPTTPATGTVAPPKQSIWKRLVTPTPQQAEGPQTVGEWMNQPRIDP